MASKCSTNELEDHIWDNNDSNSTKKNQDEVLDETRIVLSRKMLNNITKLIGVPESNAIFLNDIIQEVYYMIYCLSNGQETQYQNQVTRSLEDYCKSIVSRSNFKFKAKNLIKNIDAKVALLSFREALKIIRQSEISPKSEESLKYLPTFARKSLKNVRELFHRTKRIYVVQGLILEKIMKTLDCELEKLLVNESLTMEAAGLDCQMNDKKAVTYGIVRAIFDSTSFILPRNRIIENVMNEYIPSIAIQIRNHLKRNEVESENYADLSRMRDEIQNRKNHTADNKFSQADKFIRFKSRSLLSLDDGVEEAHVSNKENAFYGSKQGYRDKRSVNEALNDKSNSNQRRLSEIQRVGELTSAASRQYPNPPASRSMNEFFDSDLPYSSSVVEPVKVLFTSSSNDQQELDHRIEENFDKITDALRLGGISARKLDEEPRKPIQSESDFEKTNRLELNKKLQNSRSELRLPGIDRKESAGMKSMQVSATRARKSYGSTAEVKHQPDMKTVEVPLRSDDSKGLVAEALIISRPLHGHQIPLSFMIGAMNNSSGSLEVFRDSKSLRLDDFLGSRDRETKNLERNVMGEQYKGNIPLSTSFPEDYGPSTSNLNMLQDTDDTKLERELKELLNMHVQEQSRSNGKRNDETNSGMKDICNCQQIYLKDNDRNNQTNKVLAVLRKMIDYPKKFFKSKNIKGENNDTVCNVRRIQREDENEPKHEYIIAVKKLSESNSRKDFQDKIINIGDPMQSDNLKRNLLINCFNQEFSSESDPKNNHELLVKDYSKSNLRVLKNTPLTAKNVLISNAIAKKRCKKNLSKSRQEKCRARFGVGIQMRKQTSPNKTKSEKTHDNLNHLKNGSVSKLKQFENDLLRSSNNKISSHLRIDYSQSKDQLLHAIANENSANVIPLRIRQQNIKRQEKVTKKNLESDDEVERLTSFEKSPKQVDSAYYYDYYDYENPKTRIDNKDVDKKDKQMKRKLLSLSKENYKSILGEQSHHGQEKVYHVNTQYGKAPNHFGLRSTDNCKRNPFWFHFNKSTVGNVLEQTLKENHEYHEFKQHSPTIGYLTRTLKAVPQKEQVSRPIKSPLKHLFVTGDLTGFDRDPGLNNYDKSARSNDNSDRDLQALFGKKNDYEIAVNGLFHLHLGDSNDTSHETTRKKRCSRKPRSQEKVRIRRKMKNPRHNEAFRGRRQEESFDTIDKIDEPGTETKQKNSLQKISDYFKEKLESIGSSGEEAAQNKILGKATMVRISPIENKGRCDCESTPSDTTMEVSVDQQRFTTFSDDQQELTTSNSVDQQELTTSNSVDQQELTTSSDDSTTMVVDTFKPDENDVSEANTDLTSKPEKCHCSCKHTEATTSISSIDTTTDGSEREGDAEKPDIKKKKIAEILKFIEKLEQLMKDESKPLRLGDKNNGIEIRLEKIFIRPPKSDSPRDSITSTSNTIHKENNGTPGIFLKRKELQKNPDASASFRVGDVEHNPVNNGLKKYKSRERKPYGIDFENLPSKRDKSKQSFIEKQKYDKSLARESTPNGQRNNFHSRKRKRRRKSSDRRSKQQSSAS